MRSSYSPYSLVWLPVFHFTSNKLIAFSTAKLSWHLKKTTYNRSSIKSTSIFPNRFSSYFCGKGNLLSLRVLRVSVMLKFQGHRSCGPKGSSLCLDHQFSCWPCDGSKHLMSSYKAGSHPPHMSSDQPLFLFYQLLVLKCVW